MPPGSRLAHTRAERSRWDGKRQRLAPSPARGRKRRGRSASPEVRPRVRTSSGSGERRWRANAEAFGAASTALGLGAGPPQGSLASRAPTSRRIVRSHAAATRVRSRAERRVGARAQGWLQTSRRRIFLACGEASREASRSHCEIARGSAPTTPSTGRGHCRERNGCEAERANAPDHAQSPTRPTSGGTWSNRRKASWLRDRSRLTGAGRERDLARRYGIRWPRAEGACEGDE